MTSSVVLMCCVLGAVLLAGRPAPRRARSARQEGARDLCGVGGVLTALRRRFREPPDVGLQVAALVGEVAALLRAGAPDDEAWAAAAQRRPELAAVLARGDAPGVAPATAGVRAAMALSAEVGAPPADVLDHCRDALAEASDAETARRAALAGPQASARLLAALPLVGVGLGMALGARPLSVLTDGGWGTLCLLAGVALLVSGHRWVAREVDRARRQEAT